MKAPLGDQPSRQQEDDLVSMSSDYAVQFSDIDSDARGHGQSKRIFIQPPVTINLFGAGAGPAAATTFSNTGISGSSDPIISRLESQIAALSSKVEQLASQVNSVQPRLQVDGGEWSTQNIQCSYPRGPTQHRITFEKRFKSAPRVVVSINSADIDNSENFRLIVYATDIDLEGFTVHLEPWHNTYLYDCGVSWIAIGDEKE